MNKEDAKKAVYFLIPAEGSETWDYNKDAFQITVLRDRSEETEENGVSTSVRVDVQKMEAKVFVATHFRNHNFEFIFEDAYELCGMLQTALRCNTPHRGQRTYGDYLMKSSISNDDFINGIKITGKIAKKEAGISWGHYRPTYTKTSEAMCFRTATDFLGKKRRFVVRQPWSFGRPFGNKYAVEILPD